MANAKNRAAMRFFYYVNRNVNSGCPQCKAKLVVCTAVLCYPCVTAKEMPKYHIGCKGEK